MKKFFHEFKEFAMRGNVLDMAIGVVIGAAFGKITTSLVNDIIMPLIGLITGFVAHRIGGITKTDDPKHILRWTIIAAACGLIFNMFADPIIGYWYKILILGKPAADLSLKINFVATTINAVVSLVVSVAVYAALRPALKKAGFFMKLAC